MDGPAFVVADHCHDVLVLCHQLRDERAGRHHAFVLKSLMCIFSKKKGCCFGCLGPFFIHSSTLLPKYWERYVFIPRHTHLVPAFLILLSSCPRNSISWAFRLAWFFLPPEFSLPLCVIFLFPRLTSLCVLVLRAVADTPQRKMFFSENLLAFHRV